MGTLFPTLGLRTVSKLAAGGGPRRAAFPVSAPQRPPTRAQKEAIECYEKFFATRPEELPRWLREILPQKLGVHYFRVALAKASIGESDGALKYLDKAVDNGWLYIDFLKSRKELENVHGTPEWSCILGKISKKLRVHKNAKNTAK